MKLMTAEIEAALAAAPLYSQEQNDNPAILVKYFTPDSNWTWFVLEGEKLPDGDWRFFGLVNGFEQELGYFLLSELQAARGPLGLPIERDLYFSGSLKDVRDR